MNKDGLAISLFWKRTEVIKKALSRAPHVIRKSAYQYGSKETTEGYGIKGEINGGKERGQMTF